MGREGVEEEGRAEQARGETEGEVETVVAVFGGGQEAGGGAGLGAGVAGGAGEEGFDGEEAGRAVVRARRRPRSRG